VAGGVQIVLCALVDWREQAVSFIISVPLSIHTSWFVSERITVKFYIGEFMKIS
jgi:hypothetical protein